MQARSRFAGSAIRSLSGAVLVAGLAISASAFAQGGGAGTSGSTGGPVVSTSRTSPAPMVEAAVDKRWRQDPTGIGARNIVETRG